MLTTPPDSTNVVSASDVELKNILLHRTATIGVVGLGRIGLPLTVEKAKIGFHVLGFDSDESRVDSVNRAQSYIKDVKDADLASGAASGAIRATTDFALLALCDVVVVCVPTSLTANRAPDTRRLQAVAQHIALTLRPGQLVVLESTTYPGTTEELILPILAASGLKVGRDFFLAFSPERLDPANRRHASRNTSRVLGAITPACLDVAAVFYEQTIIDVVTVSSPRAAELTKLFENTFRAVNIALVNELALLCDRMHVNVWEVIDAAGTNPFGIMRFEPGPGVGGYAIPIDPFYLTWKAKQYEFGTRFIELAGEINRSMPAFVCEKIGRALNERARSVRGAHILFLGVAYKRNVSDPRHSPALKLLELLEQDGGVVVFHDPLVSEIVDYDGRARHSVALTAGCLRSADCVVVLADHSTIDWELVRRESALIVDTRNVFSEEHNRANIFPL